MKGKHFLILTVLTFVIALFFSYSVAKETQTSKLAIEKNLPSQVLRNAMEMPGNTAIEKVKRVQYI